jgi:acyl-CoA synthetase (AMP-forming)/AMP-acid ligase II
VTLPPVESTQLAALLYTSGTTAGPKGVMHTHATLRRQNANYLMVLGAPVYTQTLVPVPLCHISGFSVLLLVAREAGGTVIILPRFEPAAVLRTIGENRITFRVGCRS